MKCLEEIFRNSYVKTVSWKIFSVQHFLNQSEGLDIRCKWWLHPICWLNVVSIFYEWLQNCNTSVQLIFSLFQPIASRITPYCRIKLSFLLYFESVCISVVSCEKRYVTILLEYRDVSKFVCCCQVLSTRWVALTINGSLQSSPEYEFFVLYN